MVTEADKRQGRMVGDNDWAQRLASKLPYLPSGKSQNLDRKWVWSLLMEGKGLSEP